MRPIMRKSIAIALLMGLMAIGPGSSAGQSPRRGALAVGTGSSQAVTLQAPASLAALAATSALVSATLNEGFEGAWPGTGWELSDKSSSDDGEFLLGKRDCHPRTGSMAGWTVGGGAAGTALTCQGAYPANASTWTIYGPFSLAMPVSATLTYHFYGDTEHCSGEQCPYDYLFVGSSLDGENFQGTKFWNSWLTGPAGNGYTRDILDLSDRLGQAQVWVGIGFRSDDTVMAKGFHLDDISLFVDTGSPAHRLALMPIVYKQPTPPAAQTSTGQATSSQGASISTSSGYAITVPGGADALVRASYDLKYAYLIALLLREH